MLSRFGYARVFVKGDIFMKKLICLLLATVLMLSLFGCSGEKDPDDVRGDVTKNTSPSEEPKFSLGTTESNTYKNEFLGISCTLSSEWVFYTDEQLRELNNIVGDVAGEELAEKLEKASIIYDMCVTNVNDNSNINVNLEKVTPSQLKNTTVKALLESQIDVIKTAYENMGLTNIKVQYQKITVDGKEFDALVYSASAQGVGLYGTAFSFIKGNYMANVTVTTTQTNKVDKILGYFEIQ